MQARRRKRHGKSCRRSHALGNTVQVIEGITQQQILVETAWSFRHAMLVETAFSFRYPWPSWTWPWKEHRHRTQLPGIHGPEHQGDHGLYCIHGPEHRGNRGLYGPEHLVPNVSYSVNRKGRWNIDEQLQLLRSRPDSCEQSMFSVQRERLQVNCRLGVRTQLIAHSVLHCAVPPGREAELRAGRRDRAAARARNRRTPPQAASASLLQPQWQYWDDRKGGFVDFAEDFNQQIERHWQLVEAGLVSGCLCLPRTSRRWFEESSTMFTTVFDCKTLLRVDTCCIIGYDPHTCSETVTIKSQVAAPIVRALTRSDNTHKTPTDPIKRRRPLRSTKGVQSQDGAVRRSVGSSCSHTQVGSAPAARWTIARVNRVHSRKTAETRVARSSKRRRRRRGRTQRRLQSVEEQTVDVRFKLK